MKSLYLGLAFSALATTAIAQAGPSHTHETADSPCIKFTGSIVDPSRPFTPELDLACEKLLTLVNVTDDELGVLTIAGDTLTYDPDGAGPASPMSVVIVHPIDDDSLLQAQADGNTSAISTHVATDNDTSDTNELQFVDGVTIIGGGTPADPFVATGDGTGTDDQALTRAGDVLTLEDGGTVDLADLRSPAPVPNLDNIADDFSSPLGTISNSGTADDLELDAGLLRVRATADGCFYEYYDVRDPSTVIQTVRNRDDIQSFSATLPLDSLSYTAADLNALPVNVLTQVETQTVTWTNPSACRAATVVVTVRHGNWQANRFDAASNINLRNSALGLTPGTQFDSTEVQAGVVTYQTGTLLETNRYRVMPSATLSIPVNVSFRVFNGFPAASTATLLSLTRRASIFAVLE